MTAPDESVPDHLLRHRSLASRDPELQALMPDPTVEAALGKPGLTYMEALTVVLEGYSARPALGTRAYDVALDADGRCVRDYRPGFDLLTYGDLHRSVRAIAASLHRDGPGQVEPGDMMCIVGFGSAEFVAMELACVFLGGVSIPVSGTMGAAALRGILSDTCPRVVASAAADLAVVAELVAAQDSVGTLVVFDYDPRVTDDVEAYDSAVASLAATGTPVRVVTITELLADGRSESWQPVPPSPEGSERVALLIHSSGTTGVPKGAMLPERTAMRDFVPAATPLPLVRLSLAPLSHSAGRAMVYGTLAHGGTASFVARPDLSTLFDDMRLVRPTDGFFFPRALEIVHRRFTDMVARRVADGAEEELARSDASAELREQLLGGRLCIIRAAGAPTSAELKRFVVDELDIEIVEGYGSTEVGPVTTDDRVNRDNVIDYRLVDVPELGYLTTDRPYPRGELCVKTRTAVSGYFMKPEATAALYDADGFARTGDIMEERGPDHLVYIDRRGDVVKLAQAEFVATGSLAATFETHSALIHQMFVYATSARSSVVAVVVPDLEVARTLAGHEPSTRDLHEMIRAELQRVGVAAELRPFEVPRDFLVETEPFSQENGMLTALRKRIRPAIQQRYAESLERLFDDLDRKQDQQRAALRLGSEHASVLERVVMAVEATLGIDDAATRTGASFAELGGDSLGAIELAALLEDTFGTEMSVNSILSPAGSPERWASSLERALAGTPRTAPTCAHIHGLHPRRLVATDLALEAFIDKRAIAKAATAPPTAVDTVLLTGATGFLGRFLCLEWLERLADRGDGALICLVRAADHAAARRRLDACFLGADDRLERRYRELSEGRLEVVVGDIAEPGLGLNDAEFGRLAERVNRIVHPAALVNHVLDYEHLFAPNVAGTAAVIGLAISERLKAIDFVSSAAVMRFVDRSAGDDEDSPLLPEIELDQGYASGYGASKWAGEHLLHAASERFGLPVNLFRGDMMLPHSVYHEQLNVDDVFTRLLYSLIETGLAPESFYASDADGSRARAHYDGLPVDFIAAAIVGIGCRPHHGITTYNVTNHADDGLSLDTFADWIESAGYELERVAPYPEWLRRFEERLRSLPDDRRAHSSLEVLDHLREAMPAGRQVSGSRRFDEALLSLDVGPDTPRLTHDYIDKCLDDLARLGLVKPR